MISQCIFEFFVYNMTYTRQFYFKLYLIALVFISFGCAEKPESGLMTISIPNRTNTDLQIFDMAASVKLVQLETKDDVLLKNIKDVKGYHDKLYVEDGNGIFVFDSEGNFIKKVGQRGDGPGEFKFITIMDIDEASGTLYVSAYNKLMVFNKDAELVEERRLGFLIQYLKILDQKLFIISEKIGIEVPGGFANQTNLYELNSSLEITDSMSIRTVLLDKKEFGFFPDKNYLSNIDDGLFLYHPVLSHENMIRDTLYQVMDKSLIPVIKFNFERPQSLDNRGGQTLLLYNIINSSSYMICEYDQYWQRMLFLYDKKNATGYNLSKGLIDEEGDPVFLRPLDLANDIFYYIKKVEYVDKSIEEENPVIGIVKLK